MRQQCAACCCTDEKQVAGHELVSSSLCRLCLCLSHASSVESEADEGGVARMARWAEQRREGEQPRGGGSAGVRHAHAWDVVWVLVVVVVAPEVGEEGRGEAAARRHWEWRRCDTRSAASYALLPTVPLLLQSKHMWGQTAHGRGLRPS